MHLRFSKRKAYIPLLKKTPTTNLAPFRIFPDLVCTSIHVDRSDNTFPILDHATVIAQTTAWIKSVVIGCNFCPFAAKVMLKQSIRYVVLSESNVEKAIEAVVKEMHFLDHDADTETTFIIFPNQFASFEAYLDLVQLAEQILSELGYDGIYQIASFHPDYCFAGSSNDDPANFTNRSVYPMLHLLREESITKALESYPDPEGIPQRNIDYARHQGLLHMQKLRAACIDPI